MQNNLAWHLVMHMVLSAMPPLVIGGNGWHAPVAPAHGLVAVINRGFFIEEQKRRRRQK